MWWWIKDNVYISYICKNNFIYSILFRGIVSLLLSFFISLSFGDYIINRLNSMHFVQIIRSNGPKSHLLKQGTPTIGGIIILLSAIISIIMWNDLSNVYVQYVLYIFFTYGILGLIDDILKISRKNTIGLSVLSKYLWQSFIALVLIIFISIYPFYSISFVSWKLFFTQFIFQLDLWSIILAYFVLVGTSNAVNLSDGLDGLAIVPIILIAAGLAIIAWVISNTYHSNDLQISHILNLQELIVICFAIIGSGLGFLWFNSYPAQIFMGDTGSLAFGGVIGLITILLHQESLLLIIGSIFVIEALSVILQVSYFKFFNKRIFKMAPIHHHFELKGYSEPKIVVRFWIVSFISVCVGLVVFLMKQ